ncbi:MAG TPA: DUF2092 domain-containing protein [Bryobacteraceae bacterium]|nr:DUF2092 domain-containing protein [Bryobacteraceae bacterium]
MYYLLSPSRFISGKCLVAFAASLVFSVVLPAQSQPQLVARAASVTSPANSSDLEPLALQSLKIMSDQLRAATSFSFTARIMREEPGTNGQMLDFFRTIRVQVQRPNKMRLIVQSESSNNQIWYDGRNLTMMPGSAQFYTTIPAPPTLDGTLTMLKDKMQAHMPLLPFLSTDLYSVASQGLQTANDVGAENVGNHQYLHLAFTEPDADWQIWLSGPNQVLPQRVAIIYKKMPGQPRLNIEFSNWNLNAEIPADAFVFSKPEGAVAVNWERLHPRTIQQGGKSQ